MIETQIINGEKLEEQLFVARNETDQQITEEINAVRRDTDQQIAENIIPLNFTMLEIIDEMKVMKQRLDLLEGGLKK